MRHAGFDEDNIAQRNGNIAVPTLYFTFEAWKRLQGFLRLSNYEISGWGRVVPYGDTGNYIVTHIFLLKQEVTAVETIIPDWTMYEFMEKLPSLGMKASEMRLWWHSHVNMGRFWSRTDEQNIEAFTTQFLFSVVGLQTGEVLGRLDVARPRLTINGISIVPLLEFENGFEQGLLKEMAELVTVAPPPAPAPLYQQVPQELQEQIQQVVAQYYQTAESEKQQ